MIIYIYLRDDALKDNKGPIEVACCLSNAIAEDLLNVQLTAGQ